MDNDEAGGVLITIALLISLAISMGLNFDVTVAADEMSRANIACVNNAGLKELGKDNGGEYTAYCNNGMSYTYQLPEKK